MNHKVVVIDTHTNLSTNPRVKVLPARGSRSDMLMGHHNISAVDYSFFLPNCEVDIDKGESLYIKLDDGFIGYTGDIGNIPGYAAINNRGDEPPYDKERYQAWQAQNAQWKKPSPVAISDESIYEIHPVHAVLANDEKLSQGNFYLIDEHGRITRGSICVLYISTDKSFWVWRENDHNYTCIQPPRFVPVNLDDIHKRLSEFLNN